MRARCAVCPATTWARSPSRPRRSRTGVFVGMISNVATKLTKRGTKMATFTLEDTTGSIECICFKYDDFAEVIQEDVIAKIKGKFESGDRGNQIMAFELEALELNEEDARPSHLELRAASRSFDQNRSAHLSRIPSSYPGRDGVVLFVQQADGRRFRAELPVSVDAQSTVLKAEIRDLFGPGSYDRLVVPCALTERTDCSTLRGSGAFHIHPCFGLGVGEANLGPKGGRI